LYKARGLLDTKGVSYTGYDITGKDDERQKMIARTGGPKSVPQIFVDDKHIGGCDDLHALERSGKLDALLG
jgi:glutaredoxin 3